MFQNLWDAAKNSSKMEVNSDTDLSQEAWKFPNKQYNFKLKGIRKRRTNSKVIRRKDIIKIGEVSEIKTEEEKKKKRNETKSCF